MAGRHSERRPMLGILGLILLAIPGFALGVLAGVAWEEPGLLARHLLGRSVDVPWGAEARSQPAPPPASAVAAEKPLPPVAAPAKPKPPSATRLRAEVITPAAAARFAVQVGAFSESRAAESLAAGLRTRGFDVYVSPSATPGGSRWRVRVGPLPSRERAESVAARLKAEEKLPTWVLDENAV